MDYFSGKASDLRRVLKEDGRDILMKALSSIEAAADSLKDGAIECEMVRVLRDHSDRFLVLYDHIYREQSKIDFLRQSLNRRCIELDAFAQERDDVGTFIRMCSTLKQGNNQVNVLSMNRRRGARTIFCLHFS